MYLADTEEFADVLRECQQIQQNLGAGTKILTPEEIQKDYSFYNVDDIVLGSLNVIDEGYFDGATMFDWWKRSAREKGAEYIANEVVDMTVNADGTRVDSVTLHTGETISCGTVVNTSGPRAALTARMAGIEIPVEPRKRFTYIFKSETPLERDLPLTVDPSGIHVRTDGEMYMAGCPPHVDPAVDYTDFKDHQDLWEDHVWPILATRIPQFEAIKLVNSWVGHYSYNTLDHNAILGRHDTVNNFLFACGFSGHGTQQSPAMGRGLSELIAYGEYRSLDLSDFDYARVAANEPLIEKAVI